jgi:hypothetical protein
MKSQKIVTGLRVRYKQEWVTVDVDVTADLDAIARALVSKALHNKSKRSREIEGLVEVSIRNAAKESTSA